MRSDLGLRGYILLLAFVQCQELLLANIITISVQYAND